jgi:Flp pilus assembly protein CpaB
MSESLSAAKIAIARGPAAMTWALSLALRSANDSSERSSVSAITSEAIASPISARTPRSVAVPRSTASCNSPAAINSSSKPAS